MVALKAGRRYFQDQLVRMRKIYTTVFLWMLITMHLYSQSIPGLEWENCVMNGAFKSIAAVSDTSFAIAGIQYGCEIPTTINLRLVNGAGNIQWKKDYSFGSDYDDYVYSLETTNEGGYIFSGYENQSSAASYNLIVKTNSSGDTLWTKRIFIGSYATAVSSKIIHTADGGYCFAGSSYTSNLWDVQVIKLSATGIIQWNRTYGGTSNDYGKDLVQNADGGFTVAATTASDDSDVTGNHGGNDVWVMKLDASGNLLWQECYGGTGNDEAKSIVSIPGQRFALLSISSSNDGDVVNHHGSNLFYDYWLAKISADGTLLWNNSYGGSNYEFASQLITGYDGSFLMMGSSYSDDQDVAEHDGTTDYDDMWLVCTDSSGTILWDKSCGGSNYDHGYAIGTLNESQWVIAGSSLSDDGDHKVDCVNNSCYPISGEWMVKLNGSCSEFADADYTFTQSETIVHFTNTSTDATSYYWDFGDGKVSTSINPNHNYKNGLYTACLTASYNSCSSNTSCKTVAACITLLPDFNFLYSGLTVSFTDNTEHAAKWFWDFGDGSTDSTENPVHTYSNHGTYTVTLTTWDSCGSIYNTDKNVNTCNGIASDFNYDPGDGITYSFFDASAGAPDMWFWDFGDGTTSVLENPVHTYSNADDSITVCLTVNSDQCAAPDTKCQQLNNCIAATAAFSHSAYDNEVTFDNGSENATSYYWDFGDGTYSTDSNPVHIYPPGMNTYTVCMIANSFCGNDTSCETILVGKNPVTANFTFDTFGLTVVFTNNSTNATSYHWDFGDGSTSTSEFPFHTYSANGVYNVCLIAFDQFNLSDTMCQTVYLCESFSGVYTVNTTGLTATFTDQSAGASQWTWYFGDGGTSIVENPVHTYPANGTYNVCLITANVCGYTDTICQNITVCAPIATDFSYADTYLSVQFSDLTGTATSWLWIFSDNTFSTLQNPVHNFTAAGTYNVCLVATDLCNHSATTCHEVTVCTPLVADFTDSVNDLQVTFNDETVGALHWKWNFGDGFTSTQQNPTHTYSTNGVYQACLIATDTCGNQDTSCKSIQVCQPLVADYSYDPSYLTVSFDDLTPNATGWVWYFGDAQTSFSQNPTHTYANPGTYQVCLVASDICNNSNIICKTITVCAPVIAAFNSSSFYLTTSFSDQTGSAVGWHWDFGDGGTATSQNPIHNYVSNGTYSVCLIATDVCGYSDTLCQSLTVCAPLNANFSSTSSFLSATFNDLSATASQWHWDFGDGATSTSQNPSHTYGANGTFNVCLIATNLCGHADTLCQNITVCSALNIDFNYSTSNLSATFLDFSNNAIQWFWDFGDGSISTDQNPSHTYSSSGSYTVCLIAYNLCTFDTVCKIVEVECPPFSGDFSFEAANFNVSFHDESTNSTQWHWDFGDGTTSIIQNPVHVYGATGNYNVCLIASDGCSSDTICKNVQVIISGIDALTLDDASLTVYPNPFSGNATIEFTLTEASSVQFLIFNVEGKNIFSIPDTHYPKGLNQVMLPDLKLATGVYFLQMNSADIKAIRKLVVE